METKRVPRVLIGAAGSGSGKTTITCGLLQALKNKKKKLVSFKCGPDYIDPLFHTEVLGVPSRNLDLFFMGENTVKQLLAKNTGDADLAIIEGVMGYYDGLAPTSSYCSSYDLARKTATPGILLLDCKGMSLSILALVKGFCTLYEDNFLRGVILNRISPSIYPGIKEKIEEDLGVTVFGYLPEMKGCQLESRHLGLVTAQEIGNLQEIIDTLAAKIEQTIDLDGILALGQSAADLSYEQESLLQAEVRSIDGQTQENSLRMAEKNLTESSLIKEPSLTIGVAKDQAFCFYYQDNLDLLEELGAHLVYFSPLHDEALPGGIQGLILGGGYPELYLKQLSENKSMLNSIKGALAQGLPCIAECGGFMYLQENIQAADGVVYPMVGALEGRCTPQNKLNRFGYLELTARGDNLLSQQGEALKGHEFHYWDSTHCGADYVGKKPLRDKSWDCVVASSSLWAGYPHIHLYSNPKAALRFVERCKSFEPQ